MYGRSINVREMLTEVISRKAETAADGTMRCVRQGTAFGVHVRPVAKVGDIWAGSKMDACY